MKRILIVFVVASLAAPGQKIETQKADRLKVTRLATTQNHLSVLEFNEPVKEVAVGSSNFKVEWRENKVFVQPLEPNGTTNLFIWTASGRQSYELVPAGSVDEMHFAIDEEPTTQARQDTPPPVQPAAEQPKVPAAMLMESTPVRTLAASKSQARVEIVLQDVYQKDDRVYLRYAVVNGSRTAYLLAAPDVFTLKSPRSPQSLIPLASTQLAHDYPLRWKYQARVPVLHTEFQSPVVRPGETALGLIAFDLPTHTQAGERTVVRLSFPADAIGVVSALLVL
jgi:hypothetical protein